MYARIIESVYLGSSDTLRIFIKIVNFMRIFKLSNI